MQYPAVITREGKFILAEFPDCPGCQTFVEEGESIEEAAQEALEGWLESNLGRDLVPPQPMYAPEKHEHVLMVPLNPLLSVRLEFRWARDDEDLTQARLAHRVGMSQQQVAKLESGGNPTLSTLSRVAQGLGRRVVVILKKESEPEPPLGKYFFSASMTSPAFPKQIRSAASLSQKPLKNERVYDRGGDVRVSKTDSSVVRNVRTGSIDRTSKGGEKGRRGKK